MSQQKDGALLFVHYLVWLCQQSYNHLTFILKESAMPSNQFQVRVQTTLSPPGLRLRSQATTASDTLAFEAPGTPLTVLETEAAARPKIGVNDQWIRVRDASSREGYVAAWYVEAVSSATSTTSSTSTASTTAPNKPSAPTPVVPSPLQIPERGQALVDAINAERAKKNIPPLKVSPILTSSAQKHAEYMASGGGITHYSADGSRPFQRHLAAGYPLAGDLTRGGFASENIVAGSGMTVEEAIASWYGDEPHTNTMISDKYNECGAGVAVSGDTIYYCFDVARSTTAVPAATTQSAPAPMLAPAPTDGYVVYVPKSLTSGLRIRKQGSPSAGLVRVASAGEWLAVQEPVAMAKKKVGVQDKWLKVKDQKGNIGYVAAWLVSEA
jgi:uncharacterized protein YkwD